MLAQQMLGGLSEEGAEQDDDEEYISEDEFLNEISEQEKEIYFALVNSIYQTHIGQSIKLQQRRIDFMKKHGKNV